MFLVVNHRRNVEIHALKYLSRYNPVQDISQHYFSDFEDRPSKDSEDILSSHPGTLERFRTSGLSSSSYELSQYMNSADQCDPDTQPAITSGGG